MSRVLHVRQAGPGVTVQDLGRPGYLAAGLSRGGAVDRLALHEGAALLGQDPGCAALEMAATGGRFEAGAPLRIALTGARMRARIDGAAVAWNASHRLEAGAVLEIGPAEAGLHGYLHVGGGIATPPVLGARAAHLAAGIGRALAAGDTLPVGEDPSERDRPRAHPRGPPLGRRDPRARGPPDGDVFRKDEVARFFASQLTRDARGNRMGVRLEPEGEGFAAAAGLSVLSEAIVPGDIQITGDGTPFVLLAECQTTGGYPRIGAVLPCDLPRVAQAGPGTVLRPRLIDAGRRPRRRAPRGGGPRGPAQGLSRLVRDPGDLRDLLDHQLISGVTAGSMEEP